MRNFSALRSALLGLLAITLSLAGTLRPASAHEFDLHGLVLATKPAEGEAVIRFDPTIELPSRISTFKIEPASDVKTLKAGDAVTGTGDTDGAVWSLSNVKVTGTQAITGATADQSAIEPVDVLRNVHHVVAGDPVPNSNFVDQSGRRFDFAMLRGQPVVLAFIYTRCKDGLMCPLIAAKFGKLQALASSEALHLVTVTLDPVFDTSRILDNYGRNYGADPKRWTLATGDPKTVLNFAAQFQVTAFPDERVGLIHPERTVIIDRDGTIRELYDETAWAPDEILAQVHSDENVASNPFLRFNLWLSAKATAICGNAVAGFSGSRDLMVVIGIFAVFGFGLFRFARMLAKGAS